MTSVPLQMLKNGLTKFTATIKPHRDKLLAQLKALERISEEEEDWLKLESNLIDE
jgi:hypothetical protein